MGLGSETRYVTVDGGEVAYRVHGSGSLDVLYFYGLGSHVDMVWDDPPVGRFLDGLARFARVIVFDRRGTGASDAFEPQSPLTWEDWTEDLRAVLDAADSEQAAIIAALDAGPIALLFAATHPERVKSLVLANTSARFVEADNYPVGMPHSAMEELAELLGSLWGTEQMARLVVPELAEDVGFIRSQAKRMRAAATPRAAASQVRYIMGNVDVRAALPLVQAPTLVLHKDENPIIPCEQGRYLAEHIVGARYVSLPGRGALLNDRFDSHVSDEIADFLVGHRLGSAIDRVFTTVVFTDIAESTQKVASLGDLDWRRLLDSHDRMVRKHLADFGGREVNTTGDGFCACFDGPARAIRCATAIAQAGSRLGLEIRSGLHTGECIVRGGDLSGLTVHIAARIGSLAQPGEVLVSSTVRDLVEGSGIVFSDRGDHQLRGVSGTWRLLTANH